MCGDEDIEERRQGEGGVGTLGDLDEAECQREEEGGDDRNFFGKGETHSFSFSTRDWNGFRKPAGTGAELCVGPPKVTDSLDRRFSCDDSERKCGSSKEYPLGGMREITRE